MSSSLKVPKFASEGEEAAWWDANRELVSQEFEKAGQNDRLRRGTVMKLAMAADMGLQLSPEDVMKAQTIADRKGITFLEYLSSLIHEALERETAA